MIDNLVFGRQRVEIASSGNIEGLFTQDEWNVYYGVIMERHGDCSINGSRKGQTRFK